MATNMRRHSLKDFTADQEALRRRQEELEAQLLAEPAETWPEAAAKDERRQKLVDRALGDLARLLEREENL